MVDFRKLAISIMLFILIPEPHIEPLRSTVQTSEWKKKKKNLSLSLQRNVRTISFSFTGSVTIQTLTPIEKAMT
jgi:hypothetical protein